MNLDQRIASICADMAEAEALDIALVCFPECHLTGYTYDAAQAAEVALTLDSADVLKTVDRLAPFRTGLILGLIERDGDHLYNTALVISGGRILGRYRKTHPNERCFTAGHDYPVFDLAGLCFGVGICNDANYPQAAAQLAASGARTIFYPLNNLLPPDIATRWRARSPQNLKDRAHQTGCVVVSADVTGTVAGQTSYGCTQIVSAQGHVMAEVPEGQSGMIWVTLN
jgi:5-aminopentanamidase